MKLTKKTISEDIEYLKRIGRSNSTHIIIAILLDEETIGKAHVSHSEWSSVGYVDHIEIDQFGKVLPDYSESYSDSQYNNMQDLADQIRSEIALEQILNS